MLQQSLDQSAEWLQSGLIRPRVGSGGPERENVNMPCRKIRGLIYA